MTLSSAAAATKLPKRKAASTAFNPLSDGVIPHSTPTKTWASLRILVSGGEAGEGA